MEREKEKGKEEEESDGVDGDDVWFIPLSLVDRCWLA